MVEISYFHGDSFIVRDFSAPETGSLSDYMLS